MGEYVGRGAWNTKGVGGTLKPQTVKGKRTIVPGPYYMLGGDPMQRVGLRAFLLKTAGREREIELNELAVWHGVVALQVLLNGRGGSPCKIHGVFDEETDWAVRQAQKQLGLAVDGIVGKNTMRAFMLPIIKNVARGSMNQDWHGIYGVLANEGAFDPGAVGVLDSSDLGPAQINMPSHPNVSVSDAFCVSKSIQFVANLLAQGLNEFHDERDAVVSYNLGIGGTRMWIKAGRPDEWVPPWDNTGRSRNVKAYIDRILGQADKDGVR